MLLSEYLNLTDELDNLGVFDALLDADSPFFINILRLKDCSTPEFQDSYEHINEFFRGIIKRLDHAEKPEMSDIFYRQAYHDFKFSEVNEINLGFAEGTTGSGFGDDLRKQVLANGYKIVKAGCKDPEIFQLMALFEKGIGADRISDMISTIILPDIKKYTLRVLRDLQITPLKYPNKYFDKDGYLLNPYKKRQILILPVEILHKMTIAKEWEDVEDAIARNETIRFAMNCTVMDEWSKYSSEEKKELVRTEVFENPKKCEEVISTYRNERIDKLDLLGKDGDPEYAAKKMARDYELNGGDFKSQVLRQEIDSHRAAIEILDIFREWVENQKGWEPIQTYTRQKSEKFVQRYIAACSSYYIKVNNFDISFEADEGRGPVDVKVSRGNDKTFIEVKLSTNGEYLHGYEIQVGEYGKAEGTNSLVYLYIDMGNPGKTDKICKVCRDAKFKGYTAPDLYLVDASKKEAASKYNPVNKCQYGLFAPDDILGIGLNCDLNVDWDGRDS